MGIIGAVSGTATQVVTTQSPIENAFNALKAGATISYTGTDHSGATVTGTYTKATDTTDISDFLSTIQSDFGAAATLDGSGNLVLTDSQTGASSLGVSTLSMADAAAQPPISDSFDPTVTGDVGIAQVITSQNPLEADFDTLKAGATISYTGTDHNGAVITGTYTKATDTTDISDFLSAIQSDFGATAAIDGGGNLVLTDSQTDASSLGITAFTMTNATPPSTSFTASISASGSDGTFNKGNTVQSLSSTDSMQAAFTGLATGSSITFTGTDHSGNAVSATFVKTAGSTMSDFLQTVQKAFLGTANVSIDSSSGKLIITDKTAGTSRLAITSLSTTNAATQTTVSHTVSLSVLGKEGAGVMSAGRDAYFTLDGIAMTSSDNAVENVIGGTTVNLLKASSGETVTATLTRDTNAIKANIQKVVDAYNAFLTLANKETKYADPNDSTSTAGDLAGDSTVTSMVDRIRAQLMQPSGYSNESYNSLTMIGVKTDPSTGQMSIDDTQFTKAITSGFDQVERMRTSGTGSNSNIAFGQRAC